LVAVLICEVFICVRLPEEPAGDKSLKLYALTGNKSIALSLLVTIFPCRGAPIWWLPVGENAAEP